MSKKIEKLTKEQEEQIPVYVEKYRAISLSTEPTIQEKAEKAILDVYEYLKLEKPEIIWAEDPFVGAKLAAQYAKGDEKVTNDEVREQASKASYGSFEAYWVSFYAYITEVLPVTKDNLIEIVNRIVENAGVYWTFEKLVIMTPKPIAIHMKNEKLHNVEGLALEYDSGRGIYVLDGVRKSSLMEISLDEKFNTTRV
jgi:hypothetical protein